LQAAAHNLGSVLRKLLGAGKPREFGALRALLVALIHALLTSTKSRASILSRDIHWEALVTNFGALRRALARGWEQPRISTGC
jgi:hypothetical protein